MTLNYKIYTSKLCFGIYIKYVWWCPKKKNARKIRISVFSHSHSWWKLKIRLFWFQSCFNMCVFLKVDNKWKTKKKCLLNLLLWISANYFWRWLKWPHSIAKILPTYLHHYCLHFYSYIYCNYIVQSCMILKFILDFRIYFLGKKTKWWFRTKITFQYS